MTNEQLMEEFSLEENSQLVDGYNDCVIGSDYKEKRAVYGIERMLEQMMLKDKMTMEESMEHFDHNIGSAYIGEMTPIYVWQGESYSDRICAYEKIQES